jgi:hypothetical protein
MITLVRLEVLWVRSWPVSDHWTRYVARATVVVNNQTMLPPELLPWIVEGWL